MEIIIKTETNHFSKFDGGGLCVCLFSCVCLLFRLKHQHFSGETMDQVPVFSRNYHIYSKFRDRQAQANNADPDQLPHQQVVNWRFSNFRIGIVWS